MVYAPDHPEQAAPHLGAFTDGTWICLIAGAAFVSGIIITKSFPQRIIVLRYNYLGAVY
ncbi:MAG: hypothetical protein JWR76_1615 [Mucilaginibacter sp.]|nr:hypothetical protein [Mucilaginibacter sp.]